MDSTAACPYCTGPVSLLSLVSSVSVTDLYRCNACEKVSESPKGGNAPRPLQTRQDLASAPRGSRWSDFSVSVSANSLDRFLSPAGWRRAL